MKGDYVKVFTVGANYPLELVVNTIGRRIEVTYPTKAKTAWVVATEVTRTGKATGEQLWARLESVSGIEISAAPREPVTPAKAPTLLRKEA